MLNNIGCERFNKYKGYGHTFEWDGDFVDGTPSDEDGRKYCTLIAVDALNYERNPAEQYSLQNWLRDINKVNINKSCLRCFTEISLISQYVILHKLN